MRLVTPDPADEDAAVTMAQGRSRPAWAEIDLAAVTHNARVLASWWRRPSCAPWSRPTATATVARRWPGPRWPGARGGLAVALVDEGVELRQHGIDAPGAAAERVRRSSAVDTALAYGLTPTLYSTEAIAAFAAAAQGCGPPHRGPRQGRHRHAPGRRRRPRSCPRSSPQPSARAACWTSRACWTHLPVADGEQRGGPGLHPRAARPLRRASSPAWRAQGVTAPVLHAANTAGAIAFPAPRYDMVRCGLGLYGYLPGDTVHGRLRRGGRRRAAAARHVAQGARGRPCARSTRASAPPTAGCALCRERSVVATVPIGYADGVPRALFARRLRGAHRRAAPPAGRDGDHGPDRRRLRRRRLGAARVTRSCCSAARATRWSRPTTGRPCWGRSATRWCAAWARACPASRSTASTSPGD